MGHMSSRSGQPLARLYTALSAGRIDRRQFIEGATALGAGAALTFTLANAGAAAAAGDPAPLRNGFVSLAQDATPSAIPANGTEGQTRGAGGDLRILQWQAPSHLSPHVATGTKDFMASALVLEPLMQYLEDGSLVANLVTELPSVDNGLLAEDLTSVTYTLLPDVTWSDGTPFTAEDVKFTWEWVMNPDNGSIHVGVYEPIANIEVVDPLTAKVTFSAPNPYWPESFAGTDSGYIYPKHVLENGGQEANDAFRLKPIGTGPFVVESFAPNDSATFVANEAFRSPTKPFFGRVILKGGGDAASAARAVFQTGEYDFAWNLAIEPELLNQMTGDDSKGTLLLTPGSSIEQIMLNFSDPNKEVDGQRSEMNTPHPFFSDAAVRQAFALSIDRQTIADKFYLGGDQEPAVANVVSGIPAIESPNTTIVFDTDKASQLLEEAGWTRDGDVRKKDGVELKVTYATTVNQVRQKSQAVNKQNLEKAGFKVELQQIDAAIFFDSAAGNDQSRTHFYWDVEMHANQLLSPRPLAYVSCWYAGPYGDNIAQKSNQWNGTNNARYRSAEFDALYEAATKETDPEKLADLYIKMNDRIVDDVATVAIVRTGIKCGAAKRLNEANFALGPFTYQYWNIANWNLAEGQ
ncbi:MAG TPA: peptide ABC transporter substrate-binding protein [Thermomicrobiales bacterium]|nr:peptide ABC transporter substrate-binding protein [Thermomicrobiales bacterium]